jgi:hypothetical protein
MKADKTDAESMIIKEFLVLIYAKTVPVNIGSIKISRNRILPAALKLHITNAVINAAPKIKAKRRLIFAPLGFIG